MESTATHTIGGTGRLDAYGGGAGAGIGGNLNFGGGTIKITNGTINAVGGTDSGNGLGAGRHVCGGGSDWRGIRHKTQRQDT